MWWIFLIILIPVIAFVIFAVVRNHKRLMDRAKAIDPTVKTYSEAELVLAKDVINGKNSNKVFCKHCGAQIEEGSKFCNKCGKEQ